MSEGRYLPYYTKARLALGFPKNHRLYTTKEVAAILRRSRQWVRLQIKAKKMFAKRWSNEYYIPHTEVTRWLTWRRSSPTGVTHDEYRKARDAESNKRGKEETKT